MKIQKTSNFSRFFREGTHEEKKEVFMEVARLAVEEQKKTMEQTKETWGEETFILKYELVCTLCNEFLGVTNKKVDAISCKECSKSIPIKVPILDLNERDI